MQSGIEGEKDNERGSERGSELVSERGSERGSAKMLTRTENQILLFCKKIAKKRKKFGKFYLKTHPITYKKIKFY